MTRRVIVVAMIGVILFSVWATQSGAAQTPTPAPAPITPAVIQPTGTATPLPVQTAVRNPDDARLASCAAHTLPDFIPYLVREGDTLRGLLNGVDSVTVTQLAALNCVDDPDDLPVGAIIWVPRPLFSLNSSGTYGTGTQDALIGSFEVSAATGNNIEGVTLSWGGRGLGASLSVCQTPYSADPCGESNGSSYFPNYETTVGNFQYPGVYRYRLSMYPDSPYYPPDEAYVTFEIVCAYDWLQGVENERCPDAAPSAVMGAYQPFERGTMLWFSDTQEIYVLLPGRTVLIYEDTYREGERIDTEFPPIGFFAPTRGFGKVWAALQAEGWRLGWATAPEVGADLVRQPAGRSSYTTYVQTPGGVYAITDIPGLAPQWNQVGE